MGVAVYTRARVAMLSRHFGGERNDYTKQTRVLLYKSNILS